MKGKQLKVIPGIGIESNKSVVYKVRQNHSKYSWSGIGFRLPGLRSIFFTSVNSIVEDLLLLHCSGL
jgi:hypothetical protein